MPQYVLLRVPFCCFELKKLLASLFQHIAHIITCMLSEISLLPPTLHDIIIMGLSLCRVTSLHDWEPWKSSVDINLVPLLVKKKTYVPWLSWRRCCKPTVLLGPLWRGNREPPLTISALASLLLTRSPRWFRLAQVSDLTPANC